MTGYYRSSRSSLGVRLIAVFVFTFIIVFFLDIKLRPAIQHMAAYHAKIFAVKSINNAMVKEISSQDISYEDIVKITANNDGNVASIQTNMQKVNILKTSIADEIMEDLSKRENQMLSIPLGTLMGTQFTTGKGPPVEINVLPTGYVETSLHNKFISAGINQTLHQIILEARVEMIIIFPGYTIKTSTATSYTIAETVIIGTVPDGYTDISGDDQSLIEKVNDYKGY